MFRLQLNSQSSDVFRKVRVKMMRRKSPHTRDQRFQKKWNRSFLYFVTRNHNRNRKIKVDRTGIGTVGTEHI